MAESPGSQTMTEQLVQWLTAESGRLNALGSAEAVATAVADIAVPVLADLAIVGPGPPMPGAVAISAADDAVASEARRQLDLHPELLTRLSDLVTRERRPRWRWLPELDAGVLASLERSEPHLPPMLDALGVTSLMTLPLAARGRDQGVLLLACCRADRRLGAAELAAGQVLARRAALALDAAAAATPAAEADRHARLREAERRWVQVFERAQWGAGIIDAAELRFDSVNEALATLHGYPDPAALVGRSATDLLPREARGDLAARMRQAAIGPISYEGYHRRADRDRVPVLVTLTPLAEPHGRARSIIMQVQDLTQLRRTEERLERAQRLEAVGRLAGGVAHEVNNMMTVVLGFADLMLASHTLPDEHRADTEEIRRAADRVGSITQQLLAFSRRQLLQPEVLDLTSVVQRSVQLLRPLLPADVVVETHCSPGIPGVLADRVQLEQVLVNLAFNARDAMPEGGRLLIRTGRFHHAQGAPSPLEDVELPVGDYATIEVTDTGSGMDPETMARIFEPFFTTKDVGLGTGLGLATVYGIVKQSGGYVWARSAPGEGASFTVSFPAAEAAAVTAAPVRPAEPEASGHETVLLVEDEDAVRGLAFRVLTAAGFRVLAAADGLEALELLAVEVPRVDVVITDLVMPEMGGRQLREHLHELFPKLPVVFMSGYASDEALGRGWVDPGDPLLQKPFSAEELVRAVRNALDSRRSGERLSPAVFSDH